jgi:cytochrome-b5 reductase
MDDLLLPLAAVAVIAIAAILYFLTVMNKEKHPIALTPDFQKYPLIDKKIISHDTRRFTFALPSENHKLGLPIGQHMTIMFKDADGKTVQRSYTPVTGDETLGSVAFVIKVYRAGVHPKFPEGGKLSQYLDTLKIGDTIDMKGPKGHLTWLGKGNFTVKIIKKPLQTRKTTHIGMIAGGTGITPMLQILDAIFRDPNDTTCVKMIYANQSKFTESASSCFLIVAVMK